MKNPIPKPGNAYVLRQSPSGNNVLESVSLPQNVIVNGWSDADQLIGENDYDRFRAQIAKTFHSGERTMRKAGYAASTMWRFLKEMKKGDWVVVPHHGGVFYVAEVMGDPVYDGSKAAYDLDCCYRRPVKWLNGKRPIARNLARSRLTSRMKTQQTTAQAGDLIDEIYEALVLAEAERASGGATDERRLFATHLRKKMVEAALAEIRSGFMAEQKFERLVQQTMVALGATEARIIPRQKDKGVDIIATFSVGSVSQIQIGVQVKYHTDTTGNESIDQLWRGMKAENLTAGWLVSTGQFAPDAQSHLEKLLTEAGAQVSLVDGELFASMIVDCGLERLLRGTAVA